MPADRLVGVALAENKSVLIAAARVEEFYGRYGVQRGQQFPQFALSACGRPPARLARQHARRTRPVRDDERFLLGRSRGVLRARPVGQAESATEAARADLLRHRGEPAHRDPVAGRRHRACLREPAEPRPASRIARARRNARRSLELFDLRFKGGVISRAGAAAGPLRIRDRPRHGAGLRSRSRSRRTTLSRAPRRNPDDRARQRHRAAGAPRGSGGPAFRAPRAAARHPAGGAAARRRERADRRREGAFYPSISLTGCSAPRAPGPSVQRRRAHVELAAALYPADLHRRQLASQLLVSEARSTRRRCLLQQDDPGRFWRSRERTRGSGGKRASSSTAQRGRWRRSRDYRASRDCATKTATRATSRCWTPSAACSRRRLQYRAVAGRATALRADRSLQGARRRLGG